MNVEVVVTVYDLPSSSFECKLRFERTHYFSVEVNLILGKIRARGTSNMWTFF